jgi:hypothetical protein
MVINTTFNNISVILTILFVVVNFIGGGNYPEKTTNLLQVMI